MVASLLCHLLHVLVLVAVFGIGGRSGGGQCLGRSVVLLSLHELEWGEEKIQYSQAKPASILGKHKTAIAAAAAASAAPTVLELKHHSLTPIPASSDHAGHEPYFHSLFASDDARATSFQSTIQSPLAEPQSGQAQVPLNSGIRLQTLNYVTTVALGGDNLTVIVDTGSDLTWVQCKQCTSCYAQQDPLFDPAGSATYAAVQCNSSACTASLKAATGMSGVCGSDRASCYYALSYGDGSYSRGVLAKERVDFGDAAVEQFVFGCGLSNRGLFGGTSGLMGLGRTELSLVSQTSDQFGGVFSYCLPARMYNSSGSLALGSDTSVYRNTTPVSYTRMIADPEQPPFYFLNMTGASVGGIVLQGNGFGSGKVLIDSGTVITRLVPSVYRAVKAEFTRQFAAYPPAPAFSILDTCYNLTGYQEVKVPLLTLQFEGGVDMPVDASGMFFMVKKDGSQVCLALASLSYEDQVAIIGNYQQKNKRVVYDTIGSRLGFAEENCSYI